MKNGNQTIDMQVMTIFLAYFFSFFLSNPLRYWDDRFGPPQPTCNMIFSVVTRSTELQNLQILPSPSRHDMVEWSLQCSSDNWEERKGLGWECSSWESSCLTYTGFHLQWWGTVLHPESLTHEEIVIAQRNFPQTLLLPSHLLQSQASEWRYSCTLLKDHGSYDHT